MAEVKFNTTLENKTNTVQFFNFTDEGIEENFDGDTLLYISTLGGTSVISGVGTATDNVFTAVVDLSGVTENVNTDYDHPVYDHMYSLRSTSRVYVYGKLNIVSIA